MNSRYEPLFRSLNDVLQALERRDIEATELASRAVAQLFTAMPEAIHDATIRELFERAQREATALWQSLENEIRDNATSARASRAYHARSTP